MKRAVVFLAAGFEESEAVVTIDVLRRGGIETTVASITEELTVTGAHGLKVVADALLTDVDYSAVDALVLPGGMPGSSNLNACEPLRQLLVAHHSAGKLVAAICAAPLVLGGLGLLKGRKATCYPGFETQLAGATITGEAVTVDAGVITGRGPGVVFAFALSIVARLKGQPVAGEVSAALQS
jgi:4-methyl-5(b-hydroxyethyl)-thiazole monophosphate biosynthesis